MEKIRKWYGKDPEMLWKTSGNVMEKIWKCYRKHPEMVPKMPWKYCSSSFDYQL